MTDYVAYFLDSDVDIVELETVEISHPNFSAESGGTIFRLVNDSKYAAVDLTVRDGGMNLNFEYLDMKITRARLTNNLDYSMQINIGDVGTIFPEQLQRLYDANKLNTRPDVIYRLYRSDDLSAPMEKYSMQLIGAMTEKKGIRLDAGVQKLNLNRTGLVYSIDNIPSLEGLI